MVLVFVSQSIEIRILRGRTFLNVISWRHPVRIEKRLGSGSSYSVLTLKQEISNRGSYRHTAFHVEVSNQTDLNDLTYKYWFE